MLLDASGESFQEEKWNCCFTTNAEEMSILHREEEFGKSSEGTPGASVNLHQCEQGTGTLLQLHKYNPPTR